ncbi:hypothetical protein VNO80_08134 [Phaseolus coccineus]|uniref:Uncharacterized protein n=1 Tax=Phaseolus coccineus TaxID=3886 RepID=A0AAN9NKZ2_PHACN
MGSTLVKDVMVQWNMVMILAYQLTASNAGKLTNVKIKKASRTGANFVSSTKHYPQRYNIFFGEWNIKQFSWKQYSNTSPHSGYVNSTQHTV